MRKTVWIWIGLAGLWSLSPAPAWSAEVRFGGEFRTRGFYTNNLSDARTGGKGECRGPDGVAGNADDTCNDQEAFVDGRFRLKISAVQGMAAGVVLLDFFDGSPGDNVATLNTASTGTGNRILGSEGFGGHLDSIRLREGYLRVGWPTLNLVVGRQAFTLGNGLILDDTADAVSVAIPVGWSSLTFSQLILDNDRTGSENTSGYLANLNLAPTATLGSGFFMVYIRDRGPNLSLTPNFTVSKVLLPDPPCSPPSSPACPLSEMGDQQTNLLAFGWTLDYKGPSWHWGWEADYLRGTIYTEQPTAVLNTAGRKIDLHGINALGRLGWTGSAFDSELTGVYASGQKPDDFPPGGHRLNLNAISPNFVLGNILVNNETVSDRDGGNIGGLTAGKFSLGWRPAPPVRFEVAGIWARLTEAPLPDAPRQLGWELDTNAAWQIDPDLRLGAGLGILFPGDGWAALFNDPKAEDKMIKVSTALTYTF